ncbi:MAG TPA: peroxide stress protein YaaA [Firmicutes bacterium]|nr:peroxide stress protein YaaA [Bacillota bacterium]
MQLIISPAKKMRWDADSLPPEGKPRFWERSLQLLSCLAGLDLPQLRALLCCNDAIARRSFAEYRQLESGAALSTPALFAFDGIQYTYMAPGVFTCEELSYVKAHLRILSGFYGLLRPFDGVAPCRLEMQARLQTDFCRNVYDFWGDSLYRALREEAADGILVNLASAEYSRAVEKYLEPDVRYITCRFGRMEQGKFREKGVHVKMARGQMVRYLAECRAKTPADIKGFDRMGYAYCDALSDEAQYVFLQEKQPSQV